MTDDEPLAVVLVRGYVPPARVARVSVYCRDTGGAWLLAGGPCAVGTRVENRKPAAGAYVASARAARFALVVSAALESCKAN